MALVPALSSPAPAGSEAVLSSAVEDFQKALSDNERNMLQQTRHIINADDVIVFTAGLDLGKSTKGPSIATRLHTFLQSVFDFTTTIDTFVSSHPEIAALVWGSVKFAMTFASNYTSYFDQFSALFMRLTRHYPRFAEYQALYPTSPGLQDALSHFYAAVVRSCKHLVDVIKRPLSKQAINALWRSFSQEFQPDIEEIERCGDEVKEALELAKTKIDLEAHSLQRSARAEQSAMRHKLSGFFSDTKTQMDTIREMQSRQDLYRSRESRQVLLDRLSSHDYLRPYKEACRERHRGTAEWIFSTAGFDRWRGASTPSVLLCTGKIGSGKTILSASVITRVLATRQSPGDSVAFFFIRYDDPESQKAEVILRSILRQSLHSCSLSDNGMDIALQELDVSLCPSRQDLEAIILRRMELSKSFYVFIDGLNECEPRERHDLLDSLASLHSALPAMKVFMTTRESLTTQLRKRFPHAQHVSMASVDASLDIGLIIDKMLDERRDRGELVTGDPSLFDVIQNTLAQRADGMILWVRFLINELCIYRRDDEIREALGNLPKDLEDTFDRALDRIVSGRKSALVQRIFPWVAVAGRNLAIDELREAISLEIGQESMNRGKFVNGMEGIVAWCENLIQVDEEHNTVRFAHSTIYNFITNQRASQRHADFHFDLKDADHHAGEICVTYLHLNDFTTTVARRTQPTSIPTPTIIAQRALANR